MPPKQKSPTAHRPSTRARAGSSAKSASTSLTHKAATIAKQPSSPKRLRSKSLESSISKTTTSMQFPLAVFASFAIELATNALLIQLLGPSLSTVSRPASSTGSADGSTAQILTLAVFKVLELWLGWSSSLANLSAAEMAEFTLLTHLPHAYLLYTYYAIAPLPLLLNLVVPMFSSYMAFRLFPSYSTSAASPTTEAVADDTTTALATTLLAATLYALPLALSTATWLPTHMTVYFSSLRTLESAHAATFVGCALLLIPAGFATQRLLFRPCVAFSSSNVIGLEDHDLHFDPETATLSETAAHNLRSLLIWRNLSPQGRTVAKRTLLLAAWVVLSTALIAAVSLDCFAYPRRTVIAVPEFLSGVKSSGSWWNPFPIVDRFGRPKGRATAFDPMNRTAYRVQNRDSLVEEVVGLLGWAGVWGVGCLSAGVGMGLVGGVW